MKPHVILVFHEISSRGGIQVFSGYFVRAAREVLTNVHITVLLLHNVVPPPWFGEVVKIRFICCGSRSKLWSKVKFVLALGWCTLQSPACIVFFHMRLSKLGSFIHWLRRIPYAVIIHGHETWTLKGRWERKGLQKASIIAANSRFIMSKLLEHQQLESQRIVVFHPCVDGASFAIAPKQTSLVEKYHLAGSKIVLTVARLDKADPRKGYDKLILALPQIRKIISNVKYMLVGVGDDLPRVRNLVQELDLEESVVLAGFVRNDQLVDYYNLCDIFVMPSSREPFGIVYLEALACGKVVIAGNQDGARDAVLDGRIGLLVDPDREDQLVDAITRALKGDIDPHLLDPAYLRRTVLERFGFDAFCDRVSQLFSKLSSEQG